MTAYTLADLEQFLDARSSGNRCTLAAGVYDVSRTITVNRGRLRIEGECRGSRKETILRRGRTSDGRLFAGPLIQGNRASDIKIEGLVIEGMRFENGPHGMVDHRHPLGVAPGSPLFCCAHPISAPDAFLESKFLTPFDADISFTDVEGLRLRDLDLNSPIKFGIALGNGVRDVHVHRVSVSRGGDGGVWCGFVSPDGQTPLPLSAVSEQLRPRSVHFRRCRFEGCGAAGVYLEASRVTLDSCSFDGNHVEFPYNHDGGQIEVNYQSDSVTVESCEITNGPSLMREITTWMTDEKKAISRPQLFRVVGIEAYGSRLLFKNNRIEGQSHEGIHLNGARHVKICGRHTVIANNHLAWAKYAELGHEPRQNISVTTTDLFRKRNAVSEHICVDEVRSENGVIFWSDGSEPSLKIDHVTIRNCDLRGGSGNGVVVCENADGTSVRGANWVVAGNR